ncbi:hypothetical protein PL321_18210 [Caloramator sp. mosi_1]|uniref:hypothetical protein n=1 Tax=Caloramator sp. mosi_1 TaxID=3023090 RepID=UPI002361AFAA|nr:hypothetical protein [Caloramator sp. mosi_1]WDC84162.1 hypothetical protein PL321_18210 [Caloramator sp. mosi_1]
MNTNIIMENKLSLLKVSEILSKQLKIDENKIYRALLYLAHTKAFDFETKNKRFYEI